jgi:hypothetical protein
MIIINLIIQCAIMYSIFCRACRADGSPRGTGSSIKINPMVSVAFMLLFAASFWAAFTPIIYPSWTLVAMTGEGLSVAILQYVTGRLWRKGMPIQFAK